jgi:hypothetical protein
MVGIVSLEAKNIRLPPGLSLRFARGFNGDENRIDFGPETFG